MKLHALYGAIALGVIACNRPDSAVFGPDAPPLDTAGVGGTGGSTPPSGGAPAASGSSGSSSPGGGTTPPSGGTESAGGSSGGTEPDNGGGEPAELPGSAGEGMGGAATPPDPPAPVCGNGLIEAGEECDDAGRAGMDGCDKCKVMCAHYGAGTVKSSDNHCYRGYDEATFEGALAACEKAGAHLVTISSATENALVRELVNDSKFIGGWEELREGERGSGAYGWVTEEPFTYVNWAQGEPDMREVSCGGIIWNSQRCYEHCLVMDGKGTWNDARCDQADGYVCEWEPPAAGKP